ncbi:hypothetical protein BU15DRAFT_80472 [Melanogaster broomeanus]|nr:hypothetical protein BU15DRAFT_80472 [Melanogaster broomeanus]
MYILSAWCIRSFDPHWNQRIQRILNTDISSGTLSSPDEMEDVIEGQIGGGRRQPSPPPVETPTRLHAIVKATVKDSGVVREAQTRRSRLLEKHPAPTPLDCDDPFRSEPAALLGHAPANTSESIQCASVLFRESQDSPTEPLFLPSGSTIKSPPLRIPPAEPLAPFDAMAQSHVASDDDTPRPCPQVARVPGSGHVNHFDLGPLAGYSVDSDDVASFPSTMYIDRPDSPSPSFGSRKVPTRDVITHVGAKEQENRYYIGPGDLHRCSAELGARVRMPIQQVISRFTRQYSRTNSANDWNIYQKYFATNRALEVARLPDINSVTATPSEKMSQCYRLFQQDFPDTWQEILSMHGEAEALGDLDKTVVQHQQLFHKTA